MLVSIILSSVSVISASYKYNCFFSHILEVKEHIFPEYFLVLKYMPLMAYPLFWAHLHLPF